METVTDLGGYITLREAALILGLTPNAVYLHIRRHETPTTRAGRTLLVTLQDLAGMRITLERASHLHRTLVESRGEETWRS